MPELQSEYPSEAELRGYLRECFPAVSPELHYQLPDHCCLRDEPDPFADLLLLPSLGFDEFWQRAASAVLASLQRLNTLARDDPFWHNTNRRPTVPKLPEYSARILREAPQDELALWTLAALKLFRGGNDFGQKQWLMLSRSGDLDVRWPLYAALYTHLTAAPTVGSLARLLPDTGRLDETKPLLELLADSGAPRISRWAERVLARIEAGEWRRIGVIDRYLP